MTLLLSLQLVLLRAKKGFPRFICYPNLINDLTNLASSQTLAHVQLRVCLKYSLLVCTPYNRLLRRQITASTTDQGKFCGKGVGEVFLFAQQTNLWTPADEGEYIQCLEILQQQSDFISSPNKLFVSSSKTAFQEKCIKTAFCSSRSSTKQNI